MSLCADVRAREAERRERGDRGDLEGGRIVACGGGRELRYRGDDVGTGRRAGRERVRKIVGRVVDAKASVVV